MNKLIQLLLSVVFPLFATAQIIENPVFDRTDTPTFHLDKIKIDGDTTYLYFTYFAEDSSWVAISKNTYIEDIKGVKYPILKAEGIPYSPQTMTITESTQIPVTLCFPRISTDIFNLIESPKENAFNIYGINIRERNDSVYTWNQYDNYYNQAFQMDTLGYISQAIQFKQKQLKAANYLYGEKSVYSGSIMYDIALLYYSLHNKNTRSAMQDPNIIYDINESDNWSRNINEAILWGNKSLDILNEFSQDENMREGIARVYFTIGTCYMLIHQTDSFILYTSKSLNMRKELWGICPKYKYYLDNFIKNLISENELEKAIQYSIENLEVTKICYGENSSEYIQALQYSSVACSLAMKYDKAKDYAEEAYHLSIEFDDRNPESENTINCIINLLRIYNYCEEYSSTIKLGQQHVLLAEHVFDIATSLSEAYENNNDFKSAINYCEKSLSLCEKNTEALLRAMDRLGILYLHNGDYLKAKEEYEKLICVYDSITIQDSTFYANVLSHLGVTYSYLERHFDSIEFFHKSKKVRFNLLNSTKEDNQTLFGNYLLSIENEASAMLMNGKEDEAVPLLEEGLAFYIKNKDLIDDKYLYPRLFRLKGVYYDKKGLYKKAIDCYHQALDLQSDIDSLEYAETLYQISTTYKSMKDYDSALQFAMKAKDVVENKFGNNHPEYANIQSNIAEIYYLSDRVPQALACAQEVLDISYRSYGYYSSKYAVRLNNIASFYHGIGDIKKSIQYKKEAFQILNHIGINYGDLYSALCMDLANSYPDSTTTYLDMAKHGLILSGKTTGEMMIGLLIREAAYYLWTQNDTTRALQSYYKAIDIIKENNRERTEGYANIIDGLSDVYEGKNNKYFLEYNDSAFHIYQMLYDRNSYSYAMRLFNYGRRLFVANHRNDSIINFMKCASDIMYPNFIDATITMPYKEAYKYWYHKFGMMFNTWIPFICNNYNTCESNKLLYDNLLFTKGLMLTTDMNIRNRVLTSKNDSLIVLYKRYNDISVSLNIQYSLPPNRRIVNVDSLLLLRDNIGWSLSRKLGSDGYNMFQKYTWENVKSYLGEKEVAIEFGNYIDLDDKSYNKNYYYALIISKESDSPKLIKLFEKAEFDSLTKTERVDSLKLSFLIWKPILDIVPDAETIYFSPSGILNFWGIEYLPVVNDGETYTFHRLSSTKELCEKTTKMIINDAVLYGGIDYNLKEDTIKELSDIPVPNDILMRSISSRGSFEPLINSEEEIRQISTLLTSKGVNCSLYEADRGTEKSLKLLSGKDLNVLHLATHGMYVDLKDANDIKSKYNLQFVILDDDAEIEDKSLSRSFVVMSGGNMLMQRDSTLDASNDGILTANEISQIDLHNLDLVVLSACESALGDISSEGVFGLQRGFKKAGAKTILMSLDKVDDEATKILMVEFYRYLMNGKTKYQSLKDAQKHLRQVENGKYDKPEYWASFILLDGLN